MSNITIEIAPIDEVYEVIMEGISDYFFPELDKAYISPQVSSHISNYLECFKENLYCLVEYPYVDKVYRDSYYNYYASKHYSYPRDCIRVSLFAKKIKENDFLDDTKWENLRSIYLGFFVVRPTTNSPMGRSIINPNAIKENGFKIAMCKTETLVHGVKLIAEGFPHSAQDGETIKCAETTIWAIMEYFGHKYPEHKPTLPSKIHKAMEGHTNQRQLPSLGLTMDQISIALKELCFGTRIYSAMYFGRKLFQIIDCYIESGMPILLGLDNKADSGHVVIAMGKEYLGGNLDQVNKTKIRAWKREVNFIDSSDIPANYVIQDDNKSPYRVISLSEPGKHYNDEFASYEIDSIVVPLYPKIYLEAVVAKSLALQVLTDPDLGHDFGDDFIFRFFLTSSRSFKNHVAKQGAITKVLKSTLLITKMPKFIWCAEIYTKKGYKHSDRKAVGLIILDATEANSQSIDSLIFAGYPKRIIVVNENNFVNLQQKFENYQFYKNLK